MNEKMNGQIINFMNDVLWYITMEYGIEYTTLWHDKNFLNNILHDFIASYYMGGSNVPDTARYVVELTKKEKKNFV